MFNHGQGFVGFAVDDNSYANDALYALMSHRLTALGSAGGGDAQQIKPDQARTNLLITDQATP